MKVWRRITVAAVVCSCVAVGACGGTPSADDQEAAQDSGPVETENFEDLGQITLRATAVDPPGTLRDALEASTSEFEKKFPNVDVKISYRDFASWIKQARLTLSGNKPPDVFEGNQGYGLDGQLVKSRLILPLDKYAEAYDWESSFSSETLQQFRWTPEGRYGTGQLFGISGIGSQVGVYANKEKLRAAGLDVAGLETFSTSRRRWPPCAKSCRTVSR
jgi:raffinose/stachyose/melibiose transport system substrate-binding protein